MSVPEPERKQKKKKAPKMFSDEWFRQVAGEQALELPSFGEALRKSFGLTSPRMRRRQSAREILGMPNIGLDVDDLLEAAIDVVMHYRDAPCMQSERGREAMRLLERIVRERAGFDG